eukprot:CAMPEP_0174371522 /NCGR_PEP_ID=MMETSP0811_2-20130205/100031_1 /TAXON_ID=73025 ORGANISM="Eutreptiella gymnastica-like, Strain CCMP1594" /NCGR_SAMPLE_ID=MMETSP0811_2 /ASSEMBLY_ACC=CAM_ASM_000667 /LENGTH=61 /DNA_ID=CAMNT_0015517951 /DNA_START=32 /DNA_END=213 /DNA_ORIENTATION=-
MASVTGSPYSVLSESASVLDALVTKELGPDGLSGYKVVVLFSLGLPQSAFQRLAQRVTDAG